MRYKVFSWSEGVLPAEDSRVVVDGPGNVGQLGQHQIVATGERGHTGPFASERTHRTTCQ